MFLDQRELRYAVNVDLDTELWLTDTVATRDIRLYGLDDMLWHLQPLDSTSFEAKARCSRNVPRTVAQDILGAFTHPGGLVDPEDVQGAVRGYQSST